MSLSGLPSIARSGVGKDSPVGGRTHVPLPLCCSPVLVPTSSPPYHFSEFSYGRLFAISRVCSCT